MIGFSSTLVVLGTATGLPERQDSDLVAWLLILLLGVALGIGITGLLLVVHFARQGGRRPETRLRRSEFAVPHRRPSLSGVFPVPNRWLAIKSSNPVFVQTALGLHNPTPCSWEEGLTVAHNKKLFISPPINGWTLVIGANLPEPSEDVDKLYRFLLGLSRKVGQVQFFSVNRVVNHHAWVHASEGRVTRAYAWAGRTLWNQGRLTKAEADLSLKCFSYTDSAGTVDFGQPDPAALNTERVPLLAARWSVDPMSIDARMLKESHGIAGQMSRSKAD